MTAYFEFLTNLDLLVVGIALAATAILGFVVYFNDRQSITNKTFLLFTLVTCIWGVFNYLNHKIYTPELALWIIRFVIFSAVWQAFFLFQLFTVFPSREFKFDKKYFFVLIPIVTLTSLLTLTPLVFSKILSLTPEGAIAQIQNGPGIAVFGVVSVGLVTTALTRLFKKILGSEGTGKKPLRVILFGTLLMFALIIAFNFILPAFFNNPRFVPLGLVFVFPFIVCTSYAIVRHNLLNIQIISTEVLTFSLTVAMFFEVILSDNTQTLLFRSSIFLLVLSVGVLLIRSVVREVKQREQLQILTKKLEEANNQLQALDKARAEFISIASHQLRTPPATIKWYVGAIMDGDFGPLTPDLKASLERVESTNNSQISLIDDLLNASRIERGKLEFFFEMGNLEPLARMTYEQLIPQAKMHKLELKYEPPAKPLPQIMLDKEKVRQVINNFIDNAIKYTKQGSITVHFEQTDKDVILKVTDTGRGIAPEVAPTLFEKYTRGKDAATAASGLGLGLYVAKVVIEQNNGKIWAESPGEGKGSTFAFSLPIQSTLHETSTVDLSKDQQTTDSVESTPV